jgi:hypothetical protein
MNVLIHVCWRWEWASRYVLSEMLDLIESQDPADIIPVLLAAEKLLSLQDWCAETRAQCFIGGASVTFIPVQSERESELLLLLFDPRELVESAWFCGFNPPLKNLKSQWSRNKCDELVVSEPPSFSLSLFSPCQPNETQF